MSFTFRSAYIGPYLLSLARAEKDEIQIFRYKIPVAPEYIAQSSFVLEGCFLASWSGSPDADQVYDIGGSLVNDRASKPRPLTVDEDLTLKALTDGTYLCVAAVGIDQRVFMEKVVLAPGQRVVVPRYDLLMLGANAQVRFNGGDEVKAGIRVAYARSAEIEVTAVTESIVGFASFRA